MNVVRLISTTIAIFGWFGIPLALVCAQNRSETVQFSQQIDAYVDQQAYFRPDKAVKEGATKLASDLQVGRADDASYLRRLSLDLAGRIPTVSEARDFIDDPSMSKDQRAIDRLLQSGSYYRNIATLFRRAWVPQADTPEYASVSDGFEQWLIAELQSGTRYDKLVDKLITWNFEDTSFSAKINPSGFYKANENSPANLAASSTRAFLGVNLDCAQCHDHPFARWSREQFWQTAAFFAPLRTSTTNAALDESNLPQVVVPDTQLMYGPVLLTSVVAVPNRVETSVELKRVFSDWIAKEDEKYLARNAVNRIWAHFFGAALVEPIDDLSNDAARVGANAKLLEELSETFIASGYDIPQLIRGIVSSKAYRASTTIPPAPTNGADAEIVSSFLSLRGLTGEQLFESLQTAAGKVSDRPELGERSNTTAKRDIASTFYVESTFNSERSTSQALSMMNGTYVNQLSTVDNNPLLRSVVESKFLDDMERIDTLFLATLSRRATEAEKESIVHSAKVTSNDAADSNGGHTSLAINVFEDLFWALVNSPEFHSNR